MDMIGLFVRRIEMFLFLYKGKNYKSRFCKWRIIYIWGIIYIWSIRATVAITAEDSEIIRLRTKNR